MPRIQINTDQVSEIASVIESLNRKLSDELTASRDLFTTLGNSWSGEAYEASKAAFNEFATKYFQTYYDIIDNYVKFLRTNVSQGYFDVETANTSLSDAFK
ncbi:MAG TPA: WXG100 family type VII secretion target [Ruminococcus sp.]|nr:WXG100 family type VII secretion target [Ruminococcus sp.]